MTVSFNGSELTIGSRVITTRWPVIEAFDDGTRVIALLDPDAYLADPAYRSQRRAGMPANKNLVAYAYEGQLLWEAEFPAEVDYYGKIHSRMPLQAWSFSSFLCEIEPKTGEIIEKEFFK